jgi:hypothetical protein
MFSETYTFLLEMAVWVVVEVGQRAAHERSGDGQKTGRNGVVPETLLTICLSMVMGGNNTKGERTRVPLKCHFSLSNEANCSGGRVTFADQSHMDLPHLTLERRLVPNFHGPLCLIICV